MTSGFYFPFVCLFFSLLLIIIYFSKKRIENIENKIYSVLLISNFIGLIIEIMCYFFIRNYDVHPILSEIVLRLYLLYLCFFIMVFTDYNAVITYKSKYDDVKSINSFFKKVFFVTVVLLIVIVPFLFLLPMDIYNDNNVVAYTYGIAVNFVYLIAAVAIFVWFFYMITNYRNLRNKKYLPMFIFLAIGTVATIIQYKFPSILLMTSMETLVVSLMYHTIENPDIRIIELEKKAAEAANAASEAKTAFLSGMSHELRTPLNAIVGLSEDIIAYKDQVPQEVREDSEDIVNAADTLIEIVGNILDINKIEGGKLEIVESDYNPKHEFESLVKIMRTKIKEKPIEFNTHIDENLPTALFGDRLRIKQIINNFLSNAVKYTESGKIDFYVDWKPETNILEIKVTDTGKGIKPEDRGKLFEKFERLQVEKTSSVQGTGLGLSITKNLIELMNGQVIVDSVYGQGSTFGCTIPQKIGDPSKLEELDTEKQIRSQADYTGKHILVVDDNMLNIKVLKKAISTFNFEIDECYDGQTAVDKIKQNHYDVVLMDIMMPGMGGEEALSLLKQDPAFNTPIVALTADATTGAKEKYLSDGFVDYLAKPFTRDVIAQKLEKIIK